MKSPQTIFAIMAAPGRLAVHRQNGLLHLRRFGRLITQRFKPAHKAALKRVRLEQRQDPSKNVFAWNAVWQLQHLHEKLRFELGPLRNRGRSTRSGQHRHHCYDDNADQRMLLIDRRAWILQFVKETHDLIQANALILNHRSSSVSRTRDSTKDGISIDQPGRKPTHIAQSARWPWVHIQGLMQGEVAEVLGVSVGTVQRRINSSLLLLAKELDDLRPK